MIFFGSLFIQKLYYIIFIQVISKIAFICQILFNELTQLYNIALNTFHQNTFPLKEKQLFTGSCRPSIMQIYEILQFFPNFYQINKMKTHLVQTGVQFFFHRYLIDSKKFNPDKRPKFQNEEQMNFSSLDFGYSKTSLHKCRMVQVGEENLEQWPMYLMKRISYQAQKKEKKGKSYQVFDQNIKKISQIRTEYLCYQILKKSHRVVKMVELMNENPKKEEDQKFFYKFLARKKQQGIRNACFILEICNDGSLEERISNYRHPLSEDQIVMYGCQVLEGLIELKKKGILHRDLRPCNIFLHNDEVRFGDFDSAFIYKESQCTDIKSGIDINTTPQQIVELASLSDQELQNIGNLKLFQLQSKCDIYFFGMIVFKMVFKREYEKKFEGTDIEYLIREKVKEGFSCPALLQVMKKCLYMNVEKRIDLGTLFEQVRLIEKQRYFLAEWKQRTYLSEDPLNLFNFNSLQPQQPELMSQIQASISNTFTLSFQSVEYDFQSDFEKAALIRSTRLFASQVLRVHSRYYKTHQSSNLWNNNLKKRKEQDSFQDVMESFVIQMSVRAYYYDYLYKAILKINTKSIPKKQQKAIVAENRVLMERQLIIVLKFLFEILTRTPFKLDKHYDDKNLPYQTRKLFKDKIKINDKFNFFQGRAKTFEHQEFETYQMVDKFFSIEYQDHDSEKFQIINDNVLYMIENVDKKLKSLLRESIVDLFRPYDSSRKAKLSHLKETLFTMIVLEKQELKNMKKSNIVMLKNLLEPLFNGIVTLDSEQAQLFFDNYKSIHKKQVEESKRKEGMKISMNLLGVSKKHLDCLFAFMTPFTTVNQGQKVQEKTKPPIQPVKDEAEDQDQDDDGFRKPKSVKFKTSSVNFELNNQLQLEKFQEEFVQQPQKSHIEVELYEINNHSDFEQNLKTSTNPLKT